MCRVFVMQQQSSRFVAQELTDAVVEDEPADDDVVDPVAAAAGVACGGAVIVSLEAGPEGCEFMCQLP